MGLFDSVNVRIPCPKCGATVDGFQSKDAQCNIMLIDPTEVDRFYDYCRCGTKVVMVREPTEPKSVRSRPYNLEEVTDMGFRFVEE